MAEGSEALGFGKWVPGFEFLQQLAQQAGGLGAGAAQGVLAAMPMGRWVAPTLDVEELERRIQELKTVQFWLEQNSRALGATIQALEVQRMTLATLREMKLNVADVAQSLAQAAAAAPASAAAKAAPQGRGRFAGLEAPPLRGAAGEAQPKKGASKTSQALSGEASDASVSIADEAGLGGAKPEAGAAAAAAGGWPGAAELGLDAMQWWGALTQQFQSIAAQAVRDLSAQASPVGAAAAGAQASVSSAADAAAAAQTVGTRSRAAGRSGARAASRQGAAAAAADDNAGASAKPSGTPKPRARAALQRQQAAASAPVAQRSRAPAQAPAGSGAKGRSRSAGAKG